MNNALNDNQLHQVMMELRCDEQPALKKLAEQILALLYVGEVKTQTLVGLINNLYDFIKNFNPQESKIKAYNIEGDEFTVIQTINKDMPFIVDSVTEQIKADGLLIKQRMNSVFESERDEGLLMNLFSTAHKNHDPKKCSRESVLCFLTHRIEEDKLQTIEKNIADVLNRVEICVQDWPLMVKNISDARKVVEQNSLSTQEDCLETVGFLEWLIKNNFVFLGYIRLNYEKHKVIPKEDTALGVFKFTKYSDHFHESVLLEKHTYPIYITRSYVVSNVHRRTNLDLLRITVVSGKKVVGEVMIVGLFASIIYFSSIDDIPIIRKKARDLTDVSQFVPGGHSNKTLWAIIQDFPRTELFHIPVNELFHCCVGIMSITMNPRLKLFVFYDEISRFTRCMIFIPRKHFNTPIWNQMQSIISKYFSADILNEQMRGSSLMRLQVILATNDKSQKRDNKELELLLSDLLTGGWYENLRQAFSESMNSNDADRLLQKYMNVFPEGYKQDFSPKQTVYDIQNLEQLDSTENYVRSDLYVQDYVYQLKVYTCANKFSLSDMIPVIENLGMQVLDHNSYQIRLGNKEELLWVHHFNLKVVGVMFLEVEQIKEQFETTLVMVWLNRIENDYYNSLVILAGLHWKEVVLLRAWGKYLQQILFSYSQDYIRRTLARYPGIVSCLIQLFHTRFDPQMQTVENENRERLLLNKMEKFLQRVDSLADDRIIRSMINLNLATLRTNYYLGKSYVSFKFNSKQIMNLPLPHPYAEIYVYSNQFEAIHLRGGKVARGGLRWSDRFEDFRTEVLGLLKAQMPKNTVIVPVGSKGGFVVKAREEDKDLYKVIVVECYQNFLRALLDITDNIVADNVVHPADIVCKDDDDPYLVIAADKGTATFSDYANEVSNEYNFWLGDAFASGGSSGYDHKSMGITARGAWVAVERHFWEIRQDINKPFTVVGIGDMAGDVFGNGMLLSKQIQLVAAFNHLHIFIDPDPDPSASFQERKRLFEKPGLSWDDYDKKLLSEGGIVFSRKTKSLKLNDPIKKRFGIENNTLSPDELIRYILKSEVDLIWNGGIGTFVMSSNETNEMVGDKANDNIRITGKELRAKILVEGGNLGLTQLGRIEFANNGGHINTDFIDNSAGVSCSDMEVNIKIALSASMHSKCMSLKKRNALLVEMEQEVGRMILRKYNDLQTKSLTVQCLQAQYTKLEQYQRLISKLEKCGLLNRNVEFLPTDEELSQMYSEKRGLTRPQLAVLTAYAKMKLYESIVKSDLPNIEYCNQFLIQYFPSTMQQDYKEEILNHPLRKEIIATYVTNSITHRMGSTFIDGISDNTGLPEPEIVRIYMAIRESYDLRSIWAQIDALDDKVSLKCYIEMIDEVHKFVSHAGEWFFRNYPKPVNISLAIEEFSSQAKHIAENLHTILDKDSLASYDAQKQKLIANEIPEELAIKIASLSFLGASLSITQITNNLRFHGKVQVPSLTVGKIYFYIGDHLHLSWLRETSLKLESGSYWQKVSVRNLSDDIYDRQMMITSEIAKYLNDGDEDYMEAVDTWHERNAEALERYDSFLCELKTGDTLDLSRLIVIIRRLGNIV